MGWNLYEIKGWNREVGKNKQRGTVLIKLNVLGFDILLQFCSGKVTNEKCILSYIHSIELLLMTFSFSFLFVFNVYVSIFSEASTECRSFRNNILKNSIFWNIRLSFDIYVGHQHCLDVTIIEIRSPTCTNRHQLEVTNITVT